MPNIAVQQGFTKLIAEPTPTGFTNRTVTVAHLRGPQATLSTGATLADGASTTVHLPEGTALTVTSLGVTVLSVTENTTVDAVAQGALWDWSEALGAGGQAWPARTAALNNSGITLTSQTMRLTYFRACRTEVVATAKTVQGNTNANTVTLIRFGLYLEAADGGLTLVASTANDTNLFQGGSGTAVSKALGAPYTLTRGSRYAGCWLFVGTTAPTIIGVNLHSAASGMSTEMGLAPRLAGSLAGQSDLPASIAGGGLTDTTQICYSRLAT